VKVLFLCTANSCRSQMAEGWARHLHGERVEALSAGTRPAAVDARAVQVMAEAGVDISGQRSKGLDELGEHDFDLVLTVCDAARQSCPVFPSAKRVRHVSFEDPPHRARNCSSETEALEIYRRVRDEIRAFLLTEPSTWGENP
jgi:arsenate reductase